MIMPGVQKPHCRRVAFLERLLDGMKGAILGGQRFYGADSAPFACTASVRQERPALPSMRTVQQPQMPCSQPTWVPVKPQLMAEEIGQQHAHTDDRVRPFAVDRERHFERRIVRHLRPTAAAGCRALIGRSSPAHARGLCRDTARTKSLTARAPVGIVACMSSVRGNGFGRRPARRLEVGRSAPFR